MGPEAWLLGAACKYVKQRGSGSLSPSGIFPLREWLPQLHPILSITEEAPPDPGPLYLYVINKGELGEFL